MEECRTPTLPQVMEFKYDPTPTLVFEPNRLQEAQNLLVNRISVRCFTPTIKNFQSPGLSPINECLAIEVAAAGVTAAATANGDILQKSTMPPTSMVNVKEECFKAPLGKPKIVQQKLTAQQQQQFKQAATTIQQQQHFYGSKHFVSDSPPIFTLNSSVNSETDFSVEIASPDSSAILGNFTVNHNSNNNVNNNNNSSDSSNSSANLNSSNSDATSTPSNNNNNNSSNNNTTNFLNRTMNISTLLRSIGLEEYIEPFEQDLDLEEFLNIRSEDFQRLGVRTLEHQKKLLDLLSKFNDV